MTDSQDLYTHTALKIVTQAERELVKKCLERAYKRNQTIILMPQSFQQIQATKDHRNFIASKMILTNPSGKRGASALKIGSATTKSEEGNIFSNSKTVLDTNQFNPLHSYLKLIGGQNGY